MALAALLLTLTSIDPFICPPGTAHAGAPPPEKYEEWCERPDPAGRPRRHGLARTYYDSGALWTESNWADGELHGPFIEWYRNGKVARQGEYRDGKKWGLWALWYEDGSQAEEVGWDHGIQHGRFASWYPGGARKAEGRYCGGVQCSRWTTWSEDGSLLGVVDFGEIQRAP
jgi:antitoxin component YwqK of YwqJK toxin-antitoxin module